MKRLPIVFFALGIIVASCVGTLQPLDAQTIRGYSVVVNRPFRDCNLQRRSSDDYVSFGAHQIYAKRIDLEAISVGGTLVASYLVHRFLLPHHSAKVAAAVTGIGLGVGPHLYSQVFRRTYAIDVTHDAAEVAQRMAPYALTFADDGSFSHRANALLWSTALIAVGACDAQY